MPVGYIALVDHLIFYSRVPHVYNGIKYACRDNYPDTADTILYFSVCVLTLAVVVPHNCVVPPLERNCWWRILLLLETFFRSSSE